MKAKLLQAVEISENEILEAGTEVDVITSYCGCDGSYYVCELSNYRQVNINSRFLKITDWCPYINWEQRRYEIAKQIFTDRLNRCTRDTTEMAAAASIRHADIFIDKLRER